MQTARSRATLLAQAGQALYGPRWVLPLGRALQIPDGTFRPLSTGRGQITTTLWQEILELVQAKRREVILTVTSLKLQIAEDQAGQLAIVERQIRRVIREEPPATTY